MNRFLPDGGEMMAAPRSGTSALVIIATLFVFTTPAVALGKYYLLLERVHSRSPLFIGYRFCYLCKWAWYEPPFESNF